MNMNKTIVMSNGHAASTVVISKIDQRTKLLWLCLPEANCMVSRKYSEKEVNHRIQLYWPRSGSNEPAIYRYTVLSHALV